jgi:O-methyltransferase domain/Dimerisation domain
VTGYEAPSTDDRKIWELWLTHIYQAAVVAADDSGIFSALNQAPATIDELAARMDFDIRATGVLLRLLASLGLLVPRNEQYQLTDQARLYLVKSSPFYWGNMMRVGVNNHNRDTLIARLKQKGSAQAAGPEGTPAPRGDGRPADGWAAGRIPIEQAHVIAAGMHSHSLPAAIGAARNYDFSGIKHIMDVGGGSGCFMIAMAQAHPALKCTIMELDTMCEVAAAYIKDGGVGTRVDTVAVDMFRQPWPKGADAIFFSNVWHDWNPRTCTWLAEKAFDALPSGGRIMLHEQLIDDDGAGPATTAAFSMLMLLGTQGQQFTFDELKTILEKVGFGNIEAKHTASFYSITTGHKP